MVVNHTPLDDKTGAPNALIPPVKSPIYIVAVPNVIAGMSRIGTGVGIKQKEDVVVRIVAVAKNLSCAIDKKYL